MTRPPTDVSTEHGPHCDDYSKACRQCLDDFAAWKRRDVSTDGLTDAKLNEAWREKFYGLQRDYEALQRSNAEKDEALRPFAEALEEWGDDPDVGDDATLWEHPLGMCITTGDFRNARKALSHSSEQSND